MFYFALFLSAFLIGAGFYLLYQFVRDWIKDDIPAFGACILGLILLMLAASIFDAVMKTHVDTPKICKCKS
jgi:hypothetical protein